MKQVATTINRQEFIRQYPEFPWLSIDATEDIDSFLRARGWIAADERVCRCDKPGDGNMNLTMRVITDRRSLIVKQSRPWVEKYDQIPAPWNRIEYEHRFYQRIAGLPKVAARMPKLLFSDIKACVIVLEDLGDTRALTSLYAGEPIDADDLIQLAGYLGELHESTRGQADPSFENLEMRQLNHQHIFQVPLQDDNGLDLDAFESGLSAAAARLRVDQAYRTQLDWVREQYLAAGPVLLHGDYFPGSWLRTAQGIFVIDPEFCFFGEPEIDLGCTVAHLYLSKQSRESVESFLRSYAGARGGITINLALLSGFSAAEVMRRLIGVAQLPLSDSGANRIEMLERSRHAMVNQSWEELWN